MTFEMKLEPPGVKVEFGFWNALSIKIAAENKPADPFNDLYRTPPQYCLKNPLQPSGVNLSVHFAVTS